MVLIKKFAEPENKAITLDPNYPKLLFSWQCIQQVYIDLTSPVFYQGSTPSLGKIDNVIEYSNRFFELQLQMMIVTYPYAQI